MAIRLAAFFVFQLLRTSANTDPSNTRGFLVPTKRPTCVWVDYGASGPICDAQLCPSYSEVTKNAAVSNVNMPLMDAQAATYNVCVDRWRKGDKDVFAEGTECLAIQAELSGCSEDKRCTEEFADWRKRGETCVAARTEEMCYRAAPCISASARFVYAAQCLVVVMVAMFVSI